MGQYRLVSRLVIAAAFIVSLAPSDASAVILCNNLTGTPVPVLGVPQVRSDFRYVAGPGGGDDKIRTKKGTFDFLGFDPVNTHDVIITVYDAVTEVQMFQANLASGSGTFWSQPNATKFKYNDPASTVGIKKSIIKISTFFPGGHVLRKAVGVNALLTNVPFPNANGMFFVMELVDSGGNGICHGVDMPFCKTTPNRQRCDI